MRPPRARAGSAPSVQIVVQGDLIADDTTRDRLAADMAYRIAKLDRRNFG